MEKPNGSFDSPPKAMNSVNGFASGMNGHASTSRIRRVPQRRTSFFSWTFSLCLRLLAWYSIVTIIFRCPATLDQCTASSPQVCKAYFQVKQAASPHLEPYYDAYAAPYIDLARPYYDTVDQKVLTPAWAYATKYGGPRIEQAQAFGREQWEKSVQPELSKYQKVAKNKYDETLAPHVDHATAVLAPYYNIARTNALQTYNELLLPSYVFVQPYVQQGYSTASKFTTETAVPSVAWAWNKTYVFLDGTVWPQVVYVYSENVEPQIRKIGQRLGRHNTSNAQKAGETIASTAAKATSTVTKPTSLASTASATTGSSSAETSSSEPSSSELAPAASDEPPASTESVTSNESAESLDHVGEKIKEEEIPAPEVVPGESETRRTARETVAQDLKDWQEKYAQAADEGAAEIDDRIDEISKRMISRQVNTMGKSLISQLKDSVAAEVKTLKADIRDIVSQVKKSSETEEGALEKVAAAVRRAGLEIKDKSQDVRLWSENYEKELQATVTKAAENHFKILDSIRDLALQKIGMKWAWMEGVTYKDWAKYHQLKGRFDEWESDLKNLITTHPGLQEAEDKGRAIESDAMDIAQAAVKELTTLKQVGGWKITSQDDSDNFDPESTRLAAEETLKDAAAEVETPPPEPEVDTETEVEAETDAGSASPVAGTAPADEESTSAPEPVSASVAPNQDPSDASDTPDLASSAILPKTQIFLDNVTEATKPAEPAEPEKVEEIEETGAIDQGDETEALAAEESKTLDPTESVKSAFLGAAAQSVPSRQPILDDDSDNFEAVGSIISAMQSDVPATIASAASSAYSAAISGASERYSQALSLVSVQVSGTPKPAHEELLASVTSAYGNAVAAASSRLDAALSAASDGIFPTPTTNSLLPAIPTLADWAKVESIAADRLNEGRAWAEQQYESAKVAIGLATPTPTDVAGTASSIASVAGESVSGVTAAAGDSIEKMLHNAQHNYYAGLGLAQARYSEFIAAASSALSSVTATPTPTDLAGSVSSAASVASESAASVASVVGENASSIAAAGYENVAAAAGGAGSYAAESWNAVLEQISAQVYGQPTPTAWYEDFYKTAGDYAASATEVVGGGAEAVTSAAGAYAAAASDEVSKQYVLVSSIVSDLLVGKEPTLGESVYSRLAEAYEIASSTASSLASVAAETVSSATEYVKDEL